MRVPHAAENFRYYYTWDTFEPVAPNAWIGPAPRLNSLDEGLTAARASDAAIVGDAALGLANTVTFVPFTLNPNATVKLTVQMRVYGADYGAVLVFLSNEGEAADEFAYAEYEVLAPEGWKTIVHTFAPSDLEGLPARAAAGELIAGVYPGFIPDNEDYYHEISAIVLDVGTIPTRVYPRADGLGMGAPRIMDNRSPYRSARVFGMI